MSAEAVPATGHEAGTPASARPFLDIISDLSRQGVAILIISSEVRELVGLCDRILVMYEGREDSAGAQIRAFERCVERALP